MPAASTTPESDPDEIIIIYLSHVGREVGAALGSKTSPLGLSSESWWWYCQGHWWQTRSKDYSDHSGQSEQTFLDSGDTFVFSLSINALEESPRDRKRQKNIKSNEMAFLMRLSALPDRCGTHWWPEYILEG